MHKDVHDFIKHHPAAVLSTVSEFNQPWGSTIFCVADEDFNFFFVTRANTIKFQNISTNPQAALTLFDEAEQTTVQAAGVLSRVPADDYMDIVFDKLASIRPKGDYKWTPPISKIHEGDYMVMKFTPNKLQFANYKKAPAGSSTSPIKTIIPEKE